MFNSLKSFSLRVTALVALPFISSQLLSGTNIEQEFPGIGKPATEMEIKAWDIDVRPDFEGLPPGSGSVEMGEQLWLEKCTSCHGDFGDSNETFSPLVSGNITEEDIETGHVASLKDPTRVRTTLMKVATVSTLWDYINRAMPWNEPKSLDPDEVYALVAYLLNLAYIVDYDFTLSDENIAAIQQRMPNRNGMTTDHGLWRPQDTPDIKSLGCMKNCKQSIEIESFIPDFAKNAHGNLQDQMRVFGPFLGVNTYDDKGSPTTVKLHKAGSSNAVAAEQLLSQRGCLACHQINNKIIGPSFKDVTAKYQGNTDSLNYLAGKIRNGSSGVWGGTMPPMPQVSEAEANIIASWLANKTTSSP